MAPDPKYIDPNAFDDVAHRFKREGMRGSALDYENLVKIISYEENPNGSCFNSKSVVNPFIIMEYIRGRSLESFIKGLEAKTTPGEVKINGQSLEIAIGISSALDYLHEKKIVHRDVKPANIFISTSNPGHVPSIVKLGDFGVTKWGDFRAAIATGVLTVSHQQGLGTLKYMSPEQAIKPKDVTVRSDIFSLGITLFELFSCKILKSPHHVYEIITARNSRNTIAGKVHSLGINCPMDQVDLFSTILDMFLVGPKGRPSSKKLVGRLSFYLNRLNQND